MRMTQLIGNALQRKKKEMIYILIQYFIQVQKSEKNSKFQNGAKKGIYQRYFFIKFNNSVENKVSL